MLTAYDGRRVTGSIPVFACVNKCFFQDQPCKPFSRQNSKKGQCETMGFYKITVQQRLESGQFDTTREPTTPTLRAMGGSLTLLWKPFSHRSKGTPKIPASLCAAVRILQPPPCRKAGSRNTMKTPLTFDLASKGIWAAV